MLHTLGSRTRSDHLYFRDWIRQYWIGSLFQSGVEARIPLYDTDGCAYEVAGGIALGSSCDAYGRAVLFLGRRAMGRYPEHESDRRGRFAAATILSRQSKCGRGLRLDADFARGGEFCVGNQLGKRMALLCDGGSRSGDVRQFYEHDPGIGR